MADDPPVVDTKVNKSTTESSAVTDNSTMPLTPKNSKYEPLKSLSDIRTTRDLTEDGVREILRRYTKDCLEIVSMGPLEDMSGLNDAFNSSICSMEVRVKRSNSEEEDFHFVIKSPPKSYFIKMMHKFTRPFFNEVTWYEELVPVLELANGKGCIDQIQPKCYFAYSNYYMQEIEGQTSCCESRKFPWFCYVPCKSSEVGILILENIKHREKKYIMFDKSKPMDLDHVNLVMNELANFHGMWLRYKFMAQNGELANKIRRGSDGHPEVSPISWETFERRHNTQKRMPKVAYNKLKSVAKKVVLRILSQRGSEESENAEKCRHFFDTTATRWLNDYMKEKAQPVYTLCHGDFWSNNILFHYGKDQSTGSPESLVIIDYQLINVGNPCYDLVYFLYLNTDLAFRDAHLEGCLKLCYEHFSKYFGDDLKYSYEDFMEDFNRFKNIGFTTACSVMPNILSDHQIELGENPFTALSELERKQLDDLDDENSASGKEIKRRILELVREMARDKII